MKKSVNLFAKNVFFAIGANISRIFTTLILTLILPKVMSVESYSEWQLYRFYATYLVYSTLGWTEGLYMKYGGVRYQDLEKGRISSQIWGIAIHESVFACFALLIGSLLISSGDVKRQLLLGAVFYMIFHVVLSQLQAVLQASNRISDYARVYTGERFLFLAVSIGCILIGRVGFHGFILAEILSNVVLMGYAAWLCREVVFTRPLSLKNMFREEKELISIGCSVSVASFIGQLVIGVVRFGVEQRWGTVAFGKLSLSFSMAPTEVPLLSNCLDKTNSFLEHSSLYSRTIRTAKANDLSIIIFSFFIVWSCNCQFSIFNCQFKNSPRVSFVPCWHPGRNR